MSSSPAPPPPTALRLVRHQNAGTRAPYNLSAWHDEMRAWALSPQRAYLKAREAATEDAPAGESGYQLYAVTNEVQGARLVSPTTGGHVVVGRHTSCDLVVPGDESISLRHVLVRATVLDDGLPILDVLDLETASGFELSNGARQRGIVASGPIVFRIGATHLVALPIGEAHPAKLDTPVVRHVEVGGYKVNPRIEEAGSRGPSPFARTRITSIPASVPISTWSATSGSSDETASEIILESHGRRAVVRVSERDLGHGILIGRDPKCLDAGLRAVLNDGISRVHVLLIRDRDGVQLYDIASMNGMFDDVGRVRRMTMSTGRRACLGGHTRTSIEWRPCN